MISNYYVLKYLFCVNNNIPNIKVTDEEFEASFLKFHRYDEKKDLSLLCMSQKMM